jgi:hypothetical protein
MKPGRETNSTSKIQVKRKTDLFGQRVLESGKWEL